MAGFYYGSKQNQTSNWDNVEVAKWKSVVDLRRAQPPPCANKVGTCRTLEALLFRVVGLSERQNNDGKIWKARFIYDDVRLGLACYVLISFSLKAESWGRGSIATKNYCMVRLGVVLRLQRSLGSVCDKYGKAKPSLHGNNKSKKGRYPVAEKPITGETRPERRENSTRKPRNS